MPLGHISNTYDLRSKWLQESTDRTWLRLSCRSHSTRPGPTGDARRGYLVPRNSAQCACCTSVQCFVSVIHSVEQYSGMARGYIKPLTPSCVRDAPRNLFIFPPESPRHPERASPSLERFLCVLNSSRSNCVTSDIPEQRETGRSRGVTSTRGPRTWVNRVCLCVLCEFPCTLFSVLALPGITSVHSAPHFSHPMASAVTPPRQA